MIAFVLGTRPELIKVSPVVHELARRGVPVEIVHTGQHYTAELDAVFFDELDLPAPRANLRVGSLCSLKQLGAMLSGLQDALTERRPRVIVVQGDTNSVLAGALAGHKLDIPVAHLEAGLRSDDWTMPEEGNRVLAGRVAAVHFCPTDLQAARLASEGITRGVYVVGNTAVDACTTFADKARRTSGIRRRLDLTDRRFALLTMHRPSNVDEPARLRALLACLSDLARAHDTRIVFPVHPRTRESLRRHGMELALWPLLLPTEPLGYLDMLALMQSAEFVLTDSGGAQEEACTLRIPCVTLRPNTERPETVTVGANLLYSGVDPAELGAHLDVMLANERNWPNPFGDGRAAQRVADVLLDPTTRWLPSGQP